MAKRLRDEDQPRGKTFLREWRVYRDLTQEHVAELMGTSKTTISKIETGRQPYTQDTLEALARIYGSTPGHLIDTDPRKMFASSPATALLTSLSVEELQQLGHLVDIIRKAGGTASGES
jgi:transcriptional regulator with XRE-family HTH domain